MLAPSTTAPNSSFHLQNLDQNKLKNIKLGAIIIQRQGRIYCVFGADRQDKPMIRPGSDKEKSKIGVLSGHGRTWSPLRGIPIKEGGVSMQIYILGTPPGTKLLDSSRYVTANYYEGFELWLPRGPTPLGTYQAWSNTLSPNERDSSIVLWLFCCFRVSGCPSI